MNIMTEYLLKSPKVLKELIQHSQFETIANQVKPFSRVLLIGTGSSHIMSKAALPYMRKALETEVHAFRASDEIGAKASDLLIYISQTGTSINVLENLQAHPNQQKIAITENPDAIIAKSAAFTIDLLVGTEPCNAKTVGVSATFLSLVLLSYALSKRSHKAAIEKLENEIDQLELIINNYLNLGQETNLSEPQHLFVLTAPSLNAVGEEASLKYIEVALRPAVYCNIDEFSHGYNRMINKDSLILYLPDQKSDYEEPLLQLVEEAKAKILIAQSTSSILHSLAFVHGIIAMVADQLEIDPNYPIYDWFNRSVKTRL